MNGYCNNELESIVEDILSKKSHTMPLSHSSVSMDQNAFILQFAN